MTDHNCQTKYGSCIFLRVDFFKEYIILSETKIVTARNHLTLLFLHHFSMTRLVLWSAIFLAVTLDAVSSEVPSSYPASGVPSNSITSASVGQYVQRYSAPYRESPSYGVQTGYEGYLIPASSPDTDSVEEGGLLSKLLIKCHQAQILKVINVALYHFFLVASQARNVHRLVNTKSRSFEK